MIRRLGNGYCASGNGFYIYDEDLQTVLRRVAELTPKDADDEPNERARGEVREPERVRANPQSAAGE
ncbi:MAG: hypothetical protein ACREJT_17355 [Myxococcota bacterium]